MRLLQVSRALVALLAAMLVPAASDSLSPFSKVAICVPFSIKIAPGDYGIQVEAEQAVKDALKASVDSGTLQLSTASSFETSQPIKITITLPAGELAAVGSLEGGRVVLAPGFTPKSLDVSAAGTGLLLVQGLSTPELSILSKGTKNVNVAGDIGSATVSSSGTGDVYLMGVTGGVSVQTSGTGHVYADAKSPGVDISGRLTGTGRVYYTQGQCSVTSSFRSRPACVQTNDITPKEKDTNPLWTCGIRVNGPFGCSGSSSGNAIALNSDCAVPDDALKMV